MSVISRLVQWEVLPGLHCLQSPPVIPLLHTNRPAWLHAELEFENTTREALSFSLINSLLPKTEESRFLAQTRACCIHFLHQMDTTINLFLHHFLQACTKHATQVSLCKATSCCVCFCCCWQTCLCVLTAGLPSQRVNFKQTKTAFWFGRDFPISLYQSFS